MRSPGCPWSRTPRRAAGCTSSTSRSRHISVSADRKSRRPPTKKGSAMPRRKRRLSAVPRARCVVSRFGRWVCLQAWPQKACGGAPPPSSSVYTRASTRASDASSGGSRFPCRRVCVRNISNLDKHMWRPTRTQGSANSGIEASDAYEIGTRLAAGGLPAQMTFSAVSLTILALGGHEDLEPK